MIQIRVTEKEKAALMAGAEEAGLTLTAYVLRGCGVKKSRRPRRVVSEILAPLEDYPRVSELAVKEFKVTVHPEERYFGDVPAEARLLKKPIGHVFPGIAKKVQELPVKPFRPAPRCFHPNLQCAIAGEAKCQACREYNATPEEERCDPPKESYES